MIRKTLLSLCSLALLASCDNDLEIIADWKDIPVVYGVLDAQDTTHYVKFNKAFLGQGDVMMMAQEFDSLHYNEESVGIRLVESNGQSVTKTIELTLTDEFDKPEGLFSFPAQNIYKTNDVIDKDLFYSAEVYRKGVDTLIAKSSSPVDILPPVRINKPNVHSAISITPTGYVSKVEWSSVEGGKLYELKMRFNYIEFPISNPSDTVRKFIEWNFPRRQSIDLGGGEGMNYSIDFDQFIGFLSVYIPENPEVRRYVVGTDSETGLSGFSIDHACLDFTLLAAGEDLSTYIALNENSSSLVVDRPEYTNIENGMGILSSRTQDLLNGVKITNQSNDQIAQHEMTRHLNFAYFQLNENNEIDTLYVN